MAYAAFAKVDPRLLAEKEFVDNSKVVAAAGQAIGDTFKALGDYHKGVRELEEEEKDKAREQETFEFLSWQRGQEIQTAYDKFLERKKLINDGDLEGEVGEFKVPAGYTLDGATVIKTTETNNIVEPLLNVDKEKTEGTKTDEVTVTDTGDEYIIGDANLDGKVDDKDKGIYGGDNGLNSTFGGGYGRGATSVEAAKLRKKQMGAAGSNLETLSRSVLDITGQQGFDADANPIITSLATAVDNNSVHVVYNDNANNGAGGTEYVWQDKAGKWNRISADNLVKADGTIDANRLNGGRTPSKVLTNADLTNNVLASKNLEVSTAVKALAGGKYLTADEIETYSNTIINNVTEQFSQNEDQLASYIREANVQDITGPDGKPDGVIDAADAAAHFYGTLKTRPMFANTLNQDAPVSTVENSNNILNNSYVDVLDNIKTKNTAFFTNLGLKNVRFNSNGTMSYDKEVEYDDNGTLKTRLEEVTISTNSDAYDLVYNHVDATYTGKDKASVLSGFTGYRRTLAEKYGDQFTGKKETTDIKDFTTTVNAAVDSGDFTALTTGRVVGISDKYWGNAFTVTLDTGATLTLDPDNEYDMKRLQAFMAGKSDEEISNSNKTEIDDIEIN